MKRKSNNSLTPLQQRSFIRILLLLGVLALLWLVFAPNVGIYSVVKKNSSLRKLEQELGVLEEQNRELSRKIERIQSDVEYLEEIARGKYDLLKENEMVFDFSKGKEKKNQK